MGEIAERMVAGGQCSWCGNEFIALHGYPVLCSSCFSNQCKDKLINVEDRIPRSTIPDYSDVEWDSSYPGGAWYCSETDCHYNVSGQRLRKIESFNQSTEGYTPFGDE